VVRCQIEGVQNRLGICIRRVIDRFIEVFPVVPVDEVAPFGVIECFPVKKGLRNKDEIESIVQPAAGVSAARVFMGRLGVKVGVARLFVPFSRSVDGIEKPAVVVGLASGQGFVGLFGGLEDVQVSADEEKTIRGETVEIIPEGPGRFFPVRGSRAGRIIQVNPIDAECRPLPGTRLDPEDIFHNVQVCGRDSLLGEERDRVFLVEKDDVILLVDFEIRGCVGTGLVEVQDVVEKRRHAAGFRHSLDGQDVQVKSVEGEPEPGLPGGSAPLGIAHDVPGRDLYCPGRGGRRQNRDNPQDKNEFVLHGFPFRVLS